MSGIEEEFRRLIDPRTFEVKVRDEAGNETCWLELDLMGLAEVQVALDRVQQRKFGWYGS